MSHDTEPDVRLDPGSVELFQLITSGLAGPHLGLLPVYLDGGRRTEAIVGLIDKGNETSVTVLFIRVTDDMRVTNVIGEEI